MKKIMLIDSPSLSKRGQYTFEDDGTTNAGIYSSTNKFIKKDLYTFSENDVINQTIVDAGVYNFLTDSFLKINNLTINNTGMGEDKTHVSATVWMWVQRREDFYDTYTDFESSESALNNKDPLWYKHYGDQSSGWSPGTIIDNATLLTNFGGYTVGETSNADYNENWAANVNNSWDYSSQVDDIDDGSVHIGLWYLTDDPTDTNAIPPAVNDKLYIAVKTTGDQDQFFVDNLDDRYQFFEISLNTVQYHLSEGGAEFEFTANDNIKRYEDGGGSWTGNQAAAYIVDTLSVTIKRPTTELEADIPESLSNILLATTPPPRVEEYNYLLYYKLNPYNLIRWNEASGSAAEKLKVNPNALDNYNWRPVSIIKANDIDTQAYYTDDDSNIKISAPTTIELSLSIGDDDILDAQQIENFDIFKKYGSDDSSGQGKISDIQYKFCVLDWNDKEDKITDFDYIYKFLWPTTELEMLENRRDNDIFIFENVVWNGGGCTAIGCTNPDWQSGTLKHTYSEPGIKSVKLIVFSYCLNTDGFTLQTLEWKLVTVRFNLTKDLVYEDDFHEIGGADFKVIPWPHTTPIIGGVDRENSLYFNSIDKAFSEGKFLETDIIDEDKLLKSIENDELGSYTGNIDIEQVRLFKTGVYDMNTLLGIGDSLTDLLPQFSESSCTKLKYSTDGTGNPNDWNTSSIDCFSIITLDSFDPTNAYYSAECMTDIGVQYVPVIFEADIDHPSGNEACAILLLDTLQFTPYTRLEYWDGDQNQFPQESSVGTLFINDNMDKELRSKCLLELNTGTSDNTFIRDTSGNGNKGILIGDFKVKKESESVPMTRDSLIIKPTTETKDGAL